TEDGIHRLGGISLRGLLIRPPEPPCGSQRTTFRDTDVLLAETEAPRRRLLLSEIHRLVDRFSHSDPLYLFGARQHELEDGIDRLPDVAVCDHRHVVALGAPDDVVLDATDLREAVGVFGM